MAEHVECCPFDVLTVVRIQEDGVLFCVCDISLFLFVPVSVTNAIILIQSVEVLIFDSNLITFYRFWVRLVRSNSLFSGFGETKCTMIEVSSEQSRSQFICIHGAAAAAAAAALLCVVCIHGAAAAAAAAALLCVITVVSLFVT